MIDAYFDEIREIIAASSVVHSSNIAFDRRGDQVGYLRGDLFFRDDSHLHFREFIQTSEGALPRRYRYAYHYQSADKVLIFRYDNSPHFPDLPSAPHHKHTASSVISATSPDLASVLKEIESLIAVE